MKRGQAATEFLMTYGWAILVVLIAIGALAYFGVLNPNRLLPESCILTPGLSCGDFKIDSATSSATLVMRNGMGIDLNSFSVSIDGMSGEPCIGDSSTATDLNDGEEKTIVINCLIPPTKNSVFRTDLVLNYNIGSITHTKTGQIISKVE